MSVQDHGIEAIRKSAEEVTPGDKSTYYLKVANKDGSLISSGGSGGTEYTEDAAAAANPVGGQLMARRRDTPTGETTADGDVVALNSTDKGELYIKHLDAITANAGTNLNTSALAIENGGNLATLAGKDFATQTTLALIKAKTDNLDVLLSDLTTPADTQPVSAASLPLPTGAATSANQSTIIGHVDGIEVLLTTIDADTSTLAAVDFATQTTLALIKAKTDNLDVLLSDLTTPADTQPVSAASLPLPTGAATSANQTTIIGHVDGIEGLLTTIDADTSTLAGAVSGGEMAVKATNLDIRDLAAATDSVTVVEPNASSSSISRVSASATNVTISASNAFRKGLVLYNDSSSSCFVKYGATATSTSFSVKMSAESHHFIDGPIYTGIVDGIWESATGAMQVTEL